MASTGCDSPSVARAKNERPVFPRPAPSLLQFHDDLDLRRRAAGQTIDGRSDLYSLGVTLFQLLTGQLPYRNDSMAVLMRAIAHETAPNVCSLRPELPAALGDIVALALEKHPTTRYATGQEMATDLLAVARALQPLDIPL